MSKPDPEYDITKEDLDRHKEIEKQLEVDRRTLARDKGHKLLLLGPSEAGKSTILKQLRIIYAKGMSPEERNSYR
ncbi:hypothetical protein HK097_001611 [Rhizophlyctis rosea]|uniref:Uncharacterized protein n=1 Tax=Rhizophlyctis rosea TaxID=64517 RepID=A0AAD5S482_9FUNG|nr:hypothetical protein HK097_001611 [Rhizophlyctis rosea]